MAFISKDISRCYGVKFTDPSAKAICQKREQCARYNQLGRDQEDGDFTYFTWVTDHCCDGLDHSHFIQD